MSSNAASRSGDRGLGSVRNPRARMKEGSVHFVASIRLACSGSARAINRACHTSKPPTFSFERLRNAFYTFSSIFKYSERIFMHFPRGPAEGSHFQSSPATLISVRAPSSSCTTIRWHLLIRTESGDAPTQQTFACPSTSAGTH